MMCCSLANVYPAIRNVKTSPWSEFQPIYYTNAFTHPMVPVITAANPDEVQLFRWGLIPPWCSSQEKAETLINKTVNARCETVFDKPSFSDSALYRRCIVPVSGFYEWHEQDGKKYPFYITMKGVRDFALAGIYNVWHDPQTGTTIPTFCILTTVANSFMATIHNVKKRMPVILTPEQEHIWLDTTTPVADLKKLFKPYDGPLEAWPVAKIANVRGLNHNIPSVQDPFEYPELHWNIPHQEENKFSF